MGATATAPAAISVVDLHTHSTASDGLLAPARLVELAVARGLRVLGLTDHDTTAGLAEAEAAAHAAGLRLIPGVELSTAVPAGEVHILGYLLDPASAQLQEALATFREARTGRARQIVARLTAAGVPIDYNCVVAIASGATIGRPHVARALVAAGHAVSVDDAFARFLIRGRPGYVERYRLSPREVVELVRAAGGVPVLAHPHSVANLDQLLPELVTAGLGGLECYYGDYGTATHQELVALATRFGLVPTGGTDFHGPGLTHSQPLGGAPVPFSAVALLEARRATQAG